MIRALIIDDEAPGRAALRGLLRDHPEISVVGEAGTLAAAARGLANDAYDLVLLDVHLRGGSGFDLVPLVRPGARIVFVTAFDRHAVRAFEVNALDFLLKPVRPDRLAAALRRAAALPDPELPAAPRPALTPADLVHLKCGNDTTRFVPLPEIAAIASCENYTGVHLGDGTQLLVRRTMKTWEQTLPASHFVRVHRAVIVNLARYRGADRASNATLRLHLAGLPQPVRASYRYVPELRARLSALGRAI